MRSSSLFTEADFMTKRTKSDKVSNGGAKLPRHQARPDTYVSRRVELPTFIYHSILYLPVLTVQDQSIKSRDSNYR